MNLHAYVAPYVGAVNPPIAGSVQISTGDVDNADGTVTPGYSNQVGVTMQVQGLSSRDVSYISGLNIQGVMRTVFLNGDIEGMDRPFGRGGDLLKFSDKPGGTTQTWKVVASEVWGQSGWTKCIVLLQTASGA